MSFERINAYRPTFLPCSNSSSNLKRKRGEIETVNEKIQTLISDILKDSPQKVYSFLDLLCGSNFESDIGSDNKKLALETLGIVVPVKALFLENLEKLAVHYYEQHAMKNGIKTMIKTYGLTKQWEKRVARGKEQYCFVDKNPSKIAKITEQIEMAQHNYLVAKLFRKKNLDLPIASLKDLFFKEFDYAQEHDPKRLRLFEKNFLLKNEKHKKLATELEYSFNSDISLESLFFHDFVKIPNIISLISDDDLVEKNAIALATLLYDDFRAKASELTPEKDFISMTSFCALYAAISFTSDEAIFQIDFLESVPEIKLQGVYFTRAVLAFLATIDWKIDYAIEEIDKRILEMEKHPLYQLLQSE